MTAQPNARTPRTDVLVDLLEPPVGELVSEFHLTAGQALHWLAQRGKYALDAQHAPTTFSFSAEEALSMRVAERAFRLDTPATLRWWSSEQGVLEVEGAAFLQPDTGTYETVVAVRPCYLVRSTQHDPHGAVR